jgi:hypothetical protein
MAKAITCFVIIGYNKKASYANNKLRMLDLNETYDLLIKPVFDDLNIACYRAIDKNLNSSIDEVMLQEIRDADLAIADLSTLNANVMWELGVRHALKPHHTIMICEKEQMNSLPFDINRFVVHTYTHSEEGIPYKEVQRFREYFKQLVTGILQQQPGLNDSPVFQFLKNSEKKTAAQIPSLQAEPGESFASVMEKAAQAERNRDFNTALLEYAKAKTVALDNMSLKENLPLIIGRQAFCTYKLKKPDELQALVKAKLLLEELNPEQSQDLEVLGLSGAVYKRLYEITRRVEYLNTASIFYERGFQLKQDYYNGINATFMLYNKITLLKAAGQDWEDVKLKAGYIRNTVLDTCLELERKKDFEMSKDAVWVLLSIAEAYHYRNEPEKMKLYEQKAAQCNNAIAMDSYEEQKNKIITLLHQLKN